MAAKKVLQEIYGEEQIENEEVEEQDEENPEEIKEYKA